MHRENFGSLRCGITRARVVSGIFSGKRGRIRHMADVTKICTQCDRKFLVIDLEQKFLKKKNLPFPTLCPSDRQGRRLASRGERTLYKTTCQECGDSVITSYDPVKATSKILCKTHYLKYFETHEMVIQ